MATAIAQEGQLVGNVDPGSPAIAAGVKKPWRVKIARALIRNQLVYTKSSWDFAIIYLLYPTVSNAASQPSHMC